jgi:hypothetical protein
MDVSLTKTGRSVSTGLLLTGIDSHRIDIPPNLNLMRIGSAFSYRF